jgi:UDP-N-acetyl-D-mannosaminuronate dehydrogenase
VFATVDALRSRGALVTVHDPMYEDNELEALGFTPHHLGTEVDAAIVQADHAEYRSITPAEFPGIRAFIDGRRVSSADAWPGITYRVIGKAATSA